MANDDTTGRHGGNERGGRADRPRHGFQSRDKDFRGGPPRRHDAPRDRNPWRGDAPAGGQGEGQAWRPFRAPGGTESGRPPFQSRDRGFGGDRDRGPRGGQGGDRPLFRGGQGGDRPPFRGGQGGDRPPFRGPREDDRPSFGGDRPSFRDDRDEGARPSFRDRDGAPAGERPSYRQGRGGYRSFDQDLGRPERPPYQERRPEGDRPFQSRRPEGDRPFRERRPEGDRPFQSRRPDSDRPFPSRRPDGDRPGYGDRRPAPGGRSFEQRIPGSGFEQGRPLGTATRAGRSPVNQFERIQADVYGRWPVLESLRAGNVVKIYLAAGVKDSADHLREIQTIAAEKHITVTRVDRFDLDRILGNANHQGIAAACKPFRHTPFEDIVTAAGQSGEKPLVVLFDGVQDPQNLGSILRSAEAAGVDGVVLPKHNQAGITPSVVRASAGAVEHLPIAEVTNLRQSIATLKEAGYWIVGLDMEGGTDYDNFDVDSPIALVIGGEGNGVSRMVAEECDYLVRLPMRGKIGSLNASVAAGIVLYEIGRRRGTAGTPKVARAAFAPVSEVEEAADLEDEDIEDEDLDMEFDASDDVRDDEDEDEHFPDDKVEGDEVGEVEHTGIDDLGGEDEDAEDIEETPHSAEDEDAEGDDSADDTDRPADAPAAVEPEPATPHDVEAAEEPRDDRA